MPRIKDERLRLLLEQNCEERNPALGQTLLFIGKTRRVPFVMCLLVAKPATTTLSNVVLKL